MRKALKDLRNDEDIVLLPVNKGNATVMLERSDCDENEPDTRGRHIQTIEERSNVQAGDQGYQSSEGVGKEGLHL